MNHTFLRIATALALLTAAPALFAQYQYFEDVPPSTKYFGVANRLWERTITKGCLAEPHFFCGEAGVSRADMAVLVVRTLYSVLVPGNAEGFTPPSTPYFDDVPASHPRFRYIQQLKFLGITSGCTATTYCPDYSVTNSQVAVFSVRARQIRDSGYNYNGYVYSLGSVNNAITCPDYYSCAPYYIDATPASSPLFPWIQLAREQSGPMIQPPNCSTLAFCPEDPITRGQIAFFLVYGVLGSMGLPPQQMGQGGTGSLLPPVTGVDCTSGSVLVSNDIYLLSPQDYYSASSTRGTYPDPSLWTMTVTASLNRDGTTVFAQPAQPVKTDANSNLRFPSSGTASLVPGNYLQTAAHTAVNGPCSLSSSVTSYSYPGNGTALFFPPTITSVSPAFASPGSTITVTVAGLGLTPGSSLTFSRTGVTATTLSVIDTQLTASLSVASNTSLGPVNISALAPNLGNGDPRANFTSSPISFSIGDPLQTLRDCITGASGSSSSPATCTLPSGTYTATAPVVISKSYVTIQGGSSQRLQTKLVRGTAFTDAILRVDASSPLTGVIIQNLTICGSTTLNTGASPVGCPRAPTTCGDMVARQTQRSPFPTDFQCVDLEVSNADTGQYPSNPFGTTGPYSVTIANVDLEDATGHALSLYAAGAPTAKHVNDIYIHDSAINSSAVTGILYGANFADFDDRSCDSYRTRMGVDFDFDPALFAPRNIRIENNSFVGHNTGAMGGGATRWFRLRNNTFTNNYINPQVGNPAGGTIEFDRCADQVEISGNTFSGPANPTTDTEAMELYARNITVSGNNISAYPEDGIGALSLYKAKITGNTVQNNDRTRQEGGIKVLTSFPTGGCDGMRRDTNDVTIGGNISTGNAYGVHFEDQRTPSRNTLWNVTISGDNNLAGNSAAAVGGDGPQVVVNGLFSAFARLDVPPAEHSPRALGVDNDSNSRCYTIGGQRQPGSQREMFTFPAADNAGSANVQFIHAIFSLQGDDSTGNPGPDVGAQGCHFYYAHASNTIFLDGPNGGYNWQGGTSPIGQGGGNLSNGYCIIHSATSQVVSEPYILNLKLDIEFPASSSSAARKHIYSIVGNSQGLTSGSDWKYWGWWKSQ